MANDNSLFFKSADMRNCPCKNCTRRTAVCHGTCEAYKRFNEQRQNKPPVNGYSSRDVGGK